MKEKTYPEWIKKLNVYEKASCLWAWDSDLSWKCSAIDATKKNYIQAIVADAEARYPIGVCAESEKYINLAMEG